MKKIFISGSPYFIESNIEKALPKSDDADIEFFFGDELNKSEFFSFVNSVGLFDNEKAAVIRNAEKIKDLEDFTISAKSCIESTIIATAENAADKTIKLFKGAGFEIASEAKRSAATSDSIKEIFAKRGLEISRMNAQKILDQTGGDMIMAENEAEKLELFLVGSGKKSVDALMEHVSGEKEDSIYDLVDSFGMKNVKRTLDIYSTIPNSYENNMKVFFGFSRRVTEIYYSYVDLRLLKDKHEFVRKKINEQKRFWQRTEAAAMIGYMASLDVDIKTGKKLFEDVIPELIASLGITSSR